MSFADQMREKFPEYRELTDTQLYEQLNKEFSLGRSARRLAIDMGDRPEASVGEQALKLGNTAAQGATFGFGDEIAGVAGGLIDRQMAVGGAALKVLSGRLSDAAADYKKLLMGEFFNQGYGEARDQSRRLNTEVREDLPGAAFGTEALGGAVSTLATGGLGGVAQSARAAPPIQAAAQGLSNLARPASLLGAAGAGAAGGALYGFGSGEGGLKNRAANAALGGALGAAVPLAGKTVKATASRLPSAQLAKLALNQAVGNQSFGSRRAKIAALRAVWKRLGLDMPKNVKKILDKL